MIHSISGEVCFIDTHTVTVMVAGIGLAVSTPQPSFFSVGQKVHIHTYMHWNQDQGPSLYGFANHLDRAVFLLVIGCTGIGPKIGMSVIAHLGAQQFLHAIQKEEASLLSKVPGIGLKKAEQMIVQLRGQVSNLIQSGFDVGVSDDLAEWADVAQALSSLNYTQSEVSRAMRYLSNEHGKGKVPFDKLMRHALSFLTKKA